MIASRPTPGAGEAAAGKGPETIFSGMVRSLFSFQYETKAETDARNAGDMVASGEAKTFKEALLKLDPVKDGAPTWVMHSSGDGKGILENSSAARWK